MDAEIKKYTEWKINCTESSTVIKWSDVHFFLRKVQSVSKYHTRDLLVLRVFLRHLIKLKQIKLLLLFSAFICYHERQIYVSPTCHVFLLSPTFFQCHSEKKNKIHLLIHMISSVIPYLSCIFIKSHCFNSVL